MDPLTIGLGVGAFLLYREWKKREAKKNTRQKVKGPVSGLTWVTEFVADPNTVPPFVTTYVYFALPTVGDLPLILVYRQGGGDQVPTIVSTTRDAKYQGLISAAVKDFGVRAPAKAGAYLTY